MIYHNGSHYTWQSVVLLSLLTYVTNIGTSFLNNFYVKIVWNFTYFDFVIYNTFVRHVLNRKVCYGVEDLSYGN